MRDSSLPAGAAGARPDKFIPATCRTEQGGPVGSFSTILVGTDGSESSFRAVERAAAVAADANATLLIVSAYAQMSDRESSRAAQALGEESYKVMGAHPAEDILREAIDVAKKAGAANVDTVAKHGDP